MKKMIIGALSVALSSNVSINAQTQLAGWFLDNPAPTTGSIYPRPHGGGDVPTINSTYVSGATAIAAGPGVNIYRETSGGFHVTYWEINNLNSCTFQQAQTNNDYITSTITMAPNATPVRVSQLSINAFTGAGVSSGNYFVGATMTDLTAGTPEQIINSNISVAEPAGSPSASQAVNSSVVANASSTTLYLRPARQYLIKWYIYGVTTSACINAGVKSGNFSTNICNTTAASRATSCTNLEKVGFDNPIIQVTAVDASVLPVGFKTLDAILKDGRLNVNWETSWEKNCKEYIIQASADGKSWKDIEHIKSKATGGTSDVALQYEYTASMYAITGMSIIFALLLIPAFKQRRTQWLMAAFIICILSVVACSKNRGGALHAGDNINYIRIAQKDMDGNIHYSNSIKIVKQ